MKIKQAKQISILEEKNISIALDKEFKVYLNDSYGEENIYEIANENSDNNINPYYYSQKEEEDQFLNGDIIQDDLLFSKEGENKESEALCNSTNPFIKANNVQKRKIKENTAMDNVVQENLENYSDKEKEEKHIISEDY